MNLEGSAGNEVAFDFYSTGLLLFFVNIICLKCFQWNCLCPESTCAAEWGRNKMVVLLQTVDKGLHCLMHPNKKLPADRKLEQQEEFLLTLKFYLQGGIFSKVSLPEVQNGTVYFCQLELHITSFCYMYICRLRI